MRLLWSRGPAVRAVGPQFGCRTARYTRDRNATCACCIRSPKARLVHLPQFAPRNIVGLNVRISKTIAAPVVVDSTALGKLYASPVSLARFEADAGTTNRSNVRLELHAAFGTERQAAAVRIAAS